MGPRPPDDPASALAAFTQPAQAEAIDAEIDAAVREPGVTDPTAARRGGEKRLVREERCAYLRPTVLHSESPDTAAAKKEYLFPFVTVVRCPQAEMLAKLGPTLVATAITDDAKLQRALLDAPEIDRLNFGPVPTCAIDWLQPHEGSIVETLFRARAFQRREAAGATL
jgi:acyl-CoA reductase-like NAD-dependent aldehyde dehydrogenase